MPLASMVVRVPSVTEANTVIFSSEGLTGCSSVVIKSSPQLDSEKTATSDRVSLVILANKFFIDLLFLIINNVLP